MPRLTIALRASALALPLLAPVLAPAQDAAPLETLDQRFSYMIGLQFGQSLRQQGLGDRLDVDAFAAAIGDVLEGRDPQLSEEQMQATMQEMQAIQQAELAAAAEAAAAAGAAFLAENADAPGVETTESGLQYRVVEAGDGPSPEPSDSVTVHYEGRLLDGTVFDSSYQRGQPATFGVGQVIPGWQEALQLMSVGATYEVWIPSDMAYGPRGAGDSIGPNETLNFTIELLEIGAE
jgi:FKBP-type peptidyl-prolyl cis-trans isomerase FklB